MTHREIVNQAISHSQQHDSISWIGAEEASPATHHWLTLWCDDYVSTETVSEYWGSDRQGEWRVHVRGVLVEGEIGDGDGDEDEDDDEDTEPSCAGRAQHEWRSPHHIVGGCRENPGCWSLGGDRIITFEVCAHCGAGRRTDTESPSRYTFVGQA